jgi:hypothetical protein
MNQIPHFESEFLERLSFAFRKRRKALSHLAEGAEFAKVYELIADKKTERLEIHLPYFNWGLLRLHAWPDRQVWVDARCPAKKGCAWSWTYDGRLLGDTSVTDIILALEGTIITFQHMDDSRTHEISSLWERLLARGPREVMID